MQAGPTAVFQTRTRSVVIPDGRVVAPQVPVSDFGFWVVQPVSSSPPRVFTNGTIPAAAADFEATTLSGEGPLTVAFTDRSQGLITKYHWAFGDGATATAKNPSHTYAAAGLFSVTLTVDGPNGTSVRRRENYIHVVSMPAPGEGGPLRGQLVRSGEQPGHLLYPTDPGFDYAVYYMDGWEPFPDWRVLPGGFHNAGRIADSDLQAVQRRYYRIERVPAQQ